MQKDIEKTWLFHHPVATVWDYLTKRELLATWLMENDIAPVVGHKFHFQASEDDNCRNNGLTICEVLEVSPMERFSYSWKSGPADGEITVDTVVLWTLKPKENGTELQLKHSGFADMLDLTSHEEGWTGLVQGLIDMVNKQAV